MIGGSGPIAKTVLFKMVFLATLAAFVACGGGGGAKQRILLKPELSPAQTVNLDEVVSVLTKRVQAFSMEGSVETAGTDQFAVTLPASVDSNAIAEMTRVGLLEFCEPVEDSAGNIAITTGTVSYAPGTCYPVHDAQGNIVVSGSSVSYTPRDLGASINLNRKQIVWQPAAGDLNGQPTALTSRLMMPSAQSVTAPVGKPNLLFKFNGDGATLAGEITGRWLSINCPWRSSLTARRF
jgi:hypothetical protein